VNNPNLRPVPEWAAEPVIVGGHAIMTADMFYDTTVDMNNVVYDDPNRIEYYFECMVGPDSGWITSPTYDVDISGYSIQHNIPFRYKVRDISVNHNAYKDGSDNVIWSEWKLAP